MKRHRIRLRFRPPLSSTYTLNVAGNRESVYPGIKDLVFAFLVESLPK
jgi:hypothetical protein